MVESFTCRPPLGLAFSRVGEKDQAGDITAASYWERPVTARIRNSTTMRRGKRLSLPSHFAVVTLRSRGLPRNCHWITRISLRCYDSVTVKSSPKSRMSLVCVDVDADYHVAALVDLICISRSL